jgi:hypothetical protein
MLSYGMHLLGAPVASALLSYGMQMLIASVVSVLLPYGMQLLGAAPSRNRSKLHVIATVGKTMPVGGRGLCWA